MPASRGATVCPREHGCTKTQTPRLVALTKVCGSDEAITPYVGIGSSTDPPPTGRKSQERPADPRKSWPEGEIKLDVPETALELAHTGCMVASCKPARRKVPRHAGPIESCFVWGRCTHQNTNGRSIQSSDPPPPSPPPRRNLPPAPTPGLLALDLQSRRLPLTAEIVRQIPQIVSVFRPRPFEGLGFETSLYRGRLSLGQPGEAAGIGLLGNEPLGRHGNGLLGNALLGH